MSKLIIGSSGFSQLQLGYETDINDIKTRAFTVASTATNGILPGDVLVTSGTTQMYKPAAATTDVVAGICLATNVKTDPYFPQSNTDVKFMPGEQGACVIGGSVAVKLYGTAPAEGAAVYYDLTNRAFTTTSSGTLACTNMKFRGITEGDVTVVDVIHA